MKNIGLSSVVPVLLLALNSSLSAAAETYDYPELMVTPRSSDRLEMEAKREQGMRWRTHLTLQAPALATLVAGLAQQANVDRDPNNYSQLAGIIVGGGWLAVTGALTLLDTPYTVANQEVGGIPRKTTREQLTRERFAEEAIRKQARLYTTLRWLSVATNAGASIYMLANVERRTTSAVLDGVSLALAFTPLVFSHPWRDVAQEQEDYKKRIYAPVAEASLLREPGTGSLAPGLKLSLRF
ncbi:MAG: hypothetical protein NDJ90_08900 [Oligoflexia bacterium]|nr:hypothetical protein [Oligoflexia bacterium]